MKTIEETIREAAKRGCSRSQTAELLGVTFKRLLLMLEVMEPMEWKMGAECAERRRADEGRRGIFPPDVNGTREEWIEGIRKSARARAKKYPYKGQMLTVSELVKLSGMPRETLRRRLALNPDGEKALTTPPMHRRKPQRSLKAAA